MKKLIISILLACLLVVAPNAQAASFSQPQIDSLLGLLNAFNVPSTAVSTVAQILGGAASDLPFIPSLVGFAPTVTRIVHIGHQADRTPDPEPEPEEVTETPDWVPEGALVFIDFKNGHYWVEGEGEVEAADIFEDNEADSTYFDASRISPGVGFLGGRDEATGGSYGFALKGAALAVIIGGATTITTINNVSDADSGNTGVATDWFHDPDFDGSEYYGAYFGSDHNIYDYNDGNHTVALPPYLELGRSTIGFTVDPGVRIAGSVNGSEVVSINPVATLPGPLPDVAVWYTGDSDEPGTIIESIVAYPILDDADLPTLTTPEWVPEGALVVADFVNGHYWVKDEGVVDVEDLFETYDGNIFDISKIVDGTGYTNGSADDWYGGAFTAAANALIAPSSTIVVDFERTGDVPSVYFYMYNDMSNDGDWTGKLEDGDFIVRDHAGVHSASDSGGGVSGRNKFATTLTGAELAISGNGREVVSVDDPDVVTPLDTLAFGLAAGITDQAIRSIVIYPPQDDADLPSLSEL